MTKAGCAIDRRRGRCGAQVDGVQLEARVAEPGVLSMSGQALLREAHAALAESDALSAAHALTRQDSADCDLLEQVCIPHICNGKTQIRGDCDWGAADAIR